MSATVGRVRSIIRYPVKSMAGEALDAADMAWHGVAGDRRWAFLRPKRPRGGFPWLTIRQRPDLARMRPRLVDPAAPDRSAVVVELADGSVVDVTDPRLAADLQATAMKLDRGTFDALPLSIVTSGTVDALAAATGTAPDARRLRPNLIIDAAAYAEGEWVGRALFVGEAIVRLDRRDRRCMVVLACLCGDVGLEGLEVGQRRCGVAGGELGLSRRQLGCEAATGAEACYRCDDSWRRKRSRAPESASSLAPSFKPRRIMSACEHVNATPTGADAPLAPLAVRRHGRQSQRSACTARRRIHTVWFE